jgi:probable rRNA maturation factor
MISFNYEIDFVLDNEAQYEDWINRIITSEGFEEGEINYIFCDDEYLHKINMEYLNHDTLTDIISFDYSEGNFLHGDIFVSIERVKENASDFNVSFDEELKRVLSHGVLHYCGYKDKSPKDEALMRLKENEKIVMFHVEH